ncbi:unnamed protein product, partial [Rotaria sp. Silwood2]
MHRLGSTNVSIQLLTH